jgi:hypothetical protein
LKAIGEAMKNEEFRKLLAEYAEEISNPESKQVRAAPPHSAPILAVCNVLNNSAMRMKFVKWKLCRGMMSSSSTQKYAVQV